MDSGGAPLGAGRPVEEMDSSCHVPDSARGRSPVGPGHDFYHASTNSVQSSRVQAVRIETSPVADYEPNATDTVEMRIEHRFVRGVIVSMISWPALWV